MSVEKTNTMKQRLFWVSIWAILSFIRAGAQPTGLALTGIHVIRPKTEKIIPNQTVYIEQGKIKYIGNASQVVIPASATVIDATGKYLMPGLAEMHAHIPVPDSAGDPTVFNQTMFLYLANGVTTIRGMLGQPFHLNLKDILMKQQNSNYPPNIYTSSPSFNGNSMPDIVTATAAVKKYKSDGYHFLKIHPGIKKDVYAAIANTAQSVGIDFAGHVPVDVGIQYALMSHQKTIDHLDGYIEALAPPLPDLNQNGFFGFNVTDQINLTKIKSLVILTKKSNAWMVPTQSLFTRWFSPEDPNTMLQEKEMAYMPARTRYAWLQNKTTLLKSNGYTKERYENYMKARKKLLYDLYRGGVNMILGSDAPQVMNVPGFSIHHEMEAWSQAGIPNWKILKAGTSEIARFYNKQKSEGDIDVQFWADLIVLDSNPVEDIRNTKNIFGVIHHGLWLSKTMIQDQLKSIAAAND